MSRGIFDDLEDHSRAVNVDESLTTEDLRWLRAERQFWTPERKRLVLEYEATLTPERLAAIKKLADASTAFGYVMTALLAIIAVLNLPIIGKAIGWVLDRIGGMK